MKKSDKKGTQKDINTEISATPVFGQPEDTFDMINKYGTYNIQPTADNENDYPKISQGLPRKRKK